jgi:protein phosphatase
VVDALAGLPVHATLAELIEFARARLNEANDSLRQEARARHVPVIGSTVAALLAVGDEAACLWAGDSRIYLFRHGRLQQLTRDHSQFEALRARGAEMAQAAASPNMITRAVGAADTVAFDVTTLAARDGDIFLLCSDGLSTPVEEAAIAAALAPGDCERAAQDLVAQALANGGRDNVTVVVARADDLSGDKTIVNPAL